MSWTAHLTKLIQKHGSDALGGLGHTGDIYGLIGEYIPSLASLITDALNPNTVTSTERRSYESLF